MPIGAPAVARDGGDVLLVTWANGLHLSLRVAERLAADGSVPGPRPALAGAAADRRGRPHAGEVGRVVVVDETRRSGGVGEGVLAGLVEAGFTAPVRRVAAADSFVPLGDAAHLVLVSEADIEAAIRSVLTVIGRDRQDVGASRRRRPSPRRPRGR